MAIGSVSPAAYAAPPKPAAPAKAAGKKPPTKGKADKGEDAKRVDARKHYAEGEAKFQSGDYEAAFTAYKAANDAIPAPQTLYKMAVCLDKLDKTSEAVDAYGSFLTSNPPASLESKVTDAQSRVTELKKKMPVVVKVKSDPPGAVVAIDGKEQSGPSPVDIKLTPGPHKIKVTLAGYDAYEKDLTLEPGAAETTVDAGLMKTVPIETAPPPPVVEKPIEKPVEPVAERRSNAAAFVVLGVAGAGAVVGGIFGVKALQGKSDFNNGQKTTDKADEVEKNALIADMALGAAITLGVTGTVLLLTSGGGDEHAARTTPRAQLQIAPIVSPRQAGAAATIRF